MVSPTSQPEVVLLNDGRMVTGVVSEEEGMIIVTQPIGTMKFPKKKVDRVFATIKEVYTYKLSQFPENDFDERINLAKWCLSQKMEPEAENSFKQFSSLAPSTRKPKPCWCRWTRLRHDWR